VFVTKIAQNVAKTGFVLIYTYNLQWKKGVAEKHDFCGIGTAKNSAKIRFCSKAGFEPSTPWVQIFYFRCSNE
jgi:hypothetical protein